MRLSAKDIDHGTSSRTDRSAHQLMRLIIDGNAKAFSHQYVFYKLEM